MEEQQFPLAEGMLREEAVEIVKEKDGAFPEKYLSDYLEYFDMNGREFWAVIDSFANTDMLEKVDGRLRLGAAVINALEKRGLIDRHLIIGHCSIGRCHLRLQRKHRPNANTQVTSLGVR